MSSYESDTLSAIFLGFRSRNPAERDRAKRDLAVHVQSLSQERSRDNYKRMNGEINKILFEMLRSNDSNVRLGGVLAISVLVKIDTDEDQPVKTTRYANYIRSILLSSDVDVLRAAAHAMGELSQHSSLSSELVDFEVKRAIEWLQSDRQEVRRHAAVCIIQSIAVCSPTLMYSYVSQVLDNIWIGLRDPKIMIRVDSASALGACLDILQKRDNQQRKQLYNKLLTETRAGLKLGSLEGIHGSLLVYKQLFAFTGTFMSAHYTDVCDSIFQYKDYKEPLIRRTVVEIMPQLAHYDDKAFSLRYLVDCMSFLISQLKREKDRRLLFLSIGEIALAVRSNMAYYLEPVLENVREGLSAKGRAKKDQEGPILQCLKMLASAVGQALAKHITREILDLIFTCGLSDYLRDCLQAFVTYIPPLQTTVRERLLNVLSYTLSGSPFKQPGSPDYSQQMNARAAKDYRDSMLQREGADMTEEQLITLALGMLMGFDFKGYSLSDFVRTCVITYLEHPSAQVRKVAALTSLAIYVHDPITTQVSSNSLRAVNFVLEKLLTAALTEKEADIRQAILGSFHKILDPHLSQTENVRLLFMILNDEDFTVRVRAITIIGRLTQSNPAYVIPPLRKVLIDLLTEMELSVSPKSKEEGTKLLAALIRSSKGLVKPYVKSMMRVLLPRASDPNAVLATNVIKVIGEISRVGARDMLEYVPQIMPILLAALDDQTSAAKRDASLKTLGHLASSSGYVIDPLLEYPQLFGILVNILRSEHSKEIKRETVRLMGILGALDPFKYREVLRKTQDEDEKKKDVPPIDIKLMMENKTPSHEEYYPTVAITMLMDILRDPALQTIHTQVAQAIVFIFRSLGLRCVAFIGMVVPGVLEVIRSSPVSVVEFLLRQLSIIVDVIKLHIRPHLESIFDCVREFFHVTALQVQVMSLIDHIAKALDGEFKMYVPSLIPLFISVLQKDKFESSTAATKVMNSLVTYGANIEEYVYLIVPSIVQLFDSNSVTIRVTAIESIGDLCRVVNLNDLASRIVHPLLRAMGSSNESIREAAVGTITSLCYQMGSDFTVFVDVVSKTMARHRIQSSSYDLLVSKILNNEPLPQNLSPARRRDRDREEITTAEIPSSKLPVNQQHLKLTWDTSQMSTKEDWHEWLKKLSIEFLKESPAHAIRACASIAAVHQPLAAQLFYASFYSCWTELYDQYKEDLVRALEVGLRSSNIPPEVLQTLLTLCEYMEHDEKPLPLDIRMLAQYATKCHAYAKALHYKELEFVQEPKTRTIEDLIGINNQLQQSDAAIGILKHAQRTNSLQLQESWFEKLQRWDEALESYNAKTGEEAESMNVTMGKMRCLHALGEWDQLSTLAQHKWTSSSVENKRMIAPLAAAAAWGLGQWEKVDTYVSVMKPNSPDKSFFNSILSIHRSHFDEASSEITKARDQLLTELTALVGESYTRAYGVLVRVQMLAELEEIIAYKMLPETALVQRQTMRETWTKRLKGNQRNVDIWQRMLKVRALVVSPRDDIDMWVKFSNLCRKSGRHGIAEKSLSALLETGVSTVSRELHPTRAQPQVVYAQLKYMWSANSKHDALRHLIDFTTRMAEDLGLSVDIGEEYISQTIPSDRPGATEKIQVYTKLLAKCFSKQGEWKVALNPNWKVEEADKILGSYLLATHFDRSWYKAWHLWALANFDVVQLFDGDANAGGGTANGNMGPPLMQNGNKRDVVKDHTVPALKGFFHSIALSQQKSLQDILRLLTLWFKYGGLPGPAAAISEGMKMIRSEVWLDVLPQLISRIYQTDPVVNRQLHDLLTELGKVHPQALVLPLTVAIKSDSVSRKRAATTILDRMRLHSALLVEQSDLVSFELIRVTVLWHEQWHEGLEDASRYFFGEHDTEKMFATLQPLHDLLDAGPETNREVSFQATFGRDLHDAYEWAKSFRRSNDMAHLNQAWDIYYSVFRRITRLLPQLQSLELDYVSPKLLEARDLQLAVPGTYMPGRPVIGIKKFNRQIAVISSKQRPRKLSLVGNNRAVSLKEDREYAYILKGHEDLRQDNLVMQLFGLVNMLLEDDPECFKRHLSIQQFPAIPLSPKAGMLGWVPDSDTFHSLICKYREGKLLLNIEHRIMLQMAPDYDSLTHLQKIEVFTHALDNTRGQDLYRVLWLKSRSSESWLDRRTQYTRSLAVMSMVGYILGLGDRHPSNLMMDRGTGKVIHVDFGDCFEAAMLRDKFPEKVPFRLTRMLTFAMEVSGVEGSFRLTSENVMRVLRENRESLMAILEAFAYDPLINWGFDLPADQNKSKSDRDKEKTIDISMWKRRLNLDDEEAAKLEIKETIDAKLVRAGVVLKRINDKLTGNDIWNSKNLSVDKQVDKLIQMATNIENLCQHFIGWCSFW